MDNALITIRTPVLSSGSNRFSRSWPFGAVTPRIGEIGCRYLMFRGLWHIVSSNMEGFADKRNSYNDINPPNQLPRCNPSIICHRSVLPLCSSGSRANGLSPCSQGSAIVKHRMVRIGLPPIADQAPGDLRQPACIFLDLLL